MYKTMNLGVVGCGVIGDSLAELLKDLGHEVKKYDPAKGFFNDISKAKVVFICVPTLADCKFADIKEAVNYTISKNKNGIIAIRSTVMPGMTDAFAKEQRICLFTGISEGAVSLRR